LATSSNSAWSPVVAVLTPRARALMGPGLDGPAPALTLAPDAKPKGKDMVAEMDILQGMI
jgi:hypothetical protein